MSVRAHRVIKIETTPESSFNLWHEASIADHLGLYASMSEDGGGLVGADVEKVEEMLDDDGRGFEIDPDTVEALRRDIAEVRAEGSEYIEWLCY